MQICFGRILFFNLEHIPPKETRSALANIAKDIQTVYNRNIRTASKKFDLDRDIVYFNFISSKCNNIKMNLLFTKVMEMAEQVNNPIVLFFYRRNTRLYSESFRSIVDKAVHKFEFTNIDYNCSKSCRENIIKNLSNLKKRPLLVDKCINKTIYNYIFELEWRNEFWEPDSAISLRDRFALMEIVLENDDILKEIEKDKK